LKSWSVSQWDRRNWGGEDSTWDSNEEHRVAAYALKKEERAAANALKKEERAAANALKKEERAAAANARYADAELIKIYRNDSSALIPDEVSRAEELVKARDRKNEKRSKRKHADSELIKRLHEDCNALNPDEVSGQRNW
jgi:hypothetical protein